MMHINNNICPTEIREHLALVTTTSPSYLLLASMDYSRKYFYKHGRQLVFNASQLANHMKELLRKYKIEYIKELGDDYFLDPTKVTVQFQNPYIANLIHKKLNKKGIYPELTQGRNMLFLIKSSHTYSEIERTVMSLWKFKKKY